MDVSQNRDFLGTTKQREECVVLTDRLDKDIYGVLTQPVRSFDREV
jgi:hypothetical protein